MFQGESSEKCQMLQRFQVSVQVFLDLIMKRRLRRVSVEVRRILWCTYQGYLSLDSLVSSEK